MGKSSSTTRIGTAKHMMGTSEVSLAPSLRFHIPLKRPPGGENGLAEADPAVVRGQIPVAVRAHSPAPQLCFDQPQHDLVLEHAAGEAAGGDSLALGQTAHHLAHRVGDRPVEAPGQLGPG